MKTERLTAEETKRRNNSTLSYIDCCMRLIGDRSFWEMSDDDLDSIYFVAFGHWAWHMTREGYINALKIKRLELRNENRLREISKNNFIPFRFRR